MLPKEGKQLALAESSAGPDWPDVVTRLLVEAELFPEPALLLLLGTVGPAAVVELCWPTELDVELDSCVEDDWLDEGEGLG